MWSYSAIHDKLPFVEAFWNSQKWPPRGVLKKSVLKICSKLTGKHPCWIVISIKLVFSCKFVVYFQKTFSQQQLWVAASELGLSCTLQTVHRKSIVPTTLWRLTLLTKLIQSRTSLLSDTLQVFFQKCFVPQLSLIPDMHSVCGGEPFQKKLLGNHLERYWKKTATQRFFLEDIAIYS